MGTLLEQKNLVSLILVSSFEIYGPRVRVVAPWQCKFLGSIRRVSSADQWPRSVHSLGRPSRHRRHVVSYTALRREQSGAKDKIPQQNALKVAAHRHKTSYSRLSPLLPSLSRSGAFFAPHGMPSIVFRLRGHRRPHFSCWVSEWVARGAAPQKTRAKKN